MNDLVLLFVVGCIFGLLLTMMRALRDLRDLLSEIHCVLVAILRSKP